MTTSALGFGDVSMLVHMKMTDPHPLYKPQSKAAKATVKSQVFRILVVLCHGFYILSSLVYV